MSKFLRLFALAVALGAMGAPMQALAADEAAAEAKDTVVARVDGKPIYRSEVMREIAALGPQAAQVPPQVVYPQVLERLVVTKVVSTAGYADKLQDSAEVRERLKQAEAQIVADAYVRNKVKPLITEDKVKARYDELSKKFKPEDEVRARHILVASEDEAKAIIKQLKGGADFAKLASEKSKDSGSMKEGGDLGYFPKSAMVKPFADAAFAMKTGQVSEKPVKTDFGWHVIKVEDRRKSSPPPLQAVRAQVESQVGNEEVAKMIKDLEAKAKVERFNIDGSPLAAADKSDAKETAKK